MGECTRIGGDEGFMNRCIETDRPSGRVAVCKGRPARQPFDLIAGHGRNKPNRRPATASALERCKNRVNLGYVPVRV